MIAYSIDYTCQGKNFFSSLVSAKDLKSAKNKLGKKHGYKDGRLIMISSYRVIGYY